MPRLAKPDSDFGRPSVSRLASSRGPSGPLPFTGSGGGSRTRTARRYWRAWDPDDATPDFVSVISAIVSPVGRGSLAAVPLTINA